MVRDRITDGDRIAQLLASELTGLALGALASVSVVDADPSARPAPDGTEAFGVAVDGERVGRVLLYPDRAVLELAADSGAASGAALDQDQETAPPGLSVGTRADAGDERPGDTGECGATRPDDEPGGAAGLRLTIESGAAVKPAVDAVRAWLRE
jgi:hypothetical protein